MVQLKEKMDEDKQFVKCFRRFRGVSCDGGHFPGIGECYHCNGTGVLSKRDADDLRKGIGLKNPHKSYLWSKK